MERQVRYQREADLVWARRLRETPGCERLSACIQCGTCSGTCPLSIYMDLTPRRVIALAREGFKDDVLRSRTIWLCASCYACSVDCPQEVGITDVMYNLKAEAIRERKFPRRFPIPVLAQEFRRMVQRRGRSSDTWLVLRMALRSRPAVLLSAGGASWRLLRAGRLSLRRERVRGIAKLRRALGPPEGGAP